MKFCPKCGSLLIPKKEDNKRIMACSCGYKNTDAQATTMKETIKKESEIEVVEEGKNETLPLVEAICPKCNHDKAYFWLIQTRASDEPETKFYRCEKCKHTWRDYS